MVVKRKEIKKHPLPQKRQRVLGHGQLSVLLKDFLSVQFSDVFCL